MGPISFPEPAFLMASGKERGSGIIHFSDPDFRSSGFRAHALQVISGFMAHALVESNMADDLFHGGLDHGLKAIGKSHISLKVKQYEVLRAVVIERNDVLVVLPTGYGKSLIYQVLAPVLDFFDSGHVDDVNVQQRKSIVLVISPLNALIRDQVAKLKDCGIKVCVLRGGRVMEGRRLRV